MNATRKKVNPPPPPEAVPLSHILPALAIQVVFIVADAVSMIASPVPANNLADSFR